MEGTSATWMLGEGRTSCLDMNMVAVHMLLSTGPWRIACGYAQTNVQLLGCHKTCVAHLLLGQWKPGRHQGCAHPPGVGGSPGKGLLSFLSPCNKLLGCTQAR